MEHRGKITPPFFVGPACGPAGKRHARRSPAPQTSLSTSFLSSIGLFRSDTDLSYPIFAVFQLPDELILSILSHICPDPRLTGQYARFCVQYRMKINDYHQRRMELLHLLSRTCMAMRLRFVPWIWDHIQLSRCSYDSDGIADISWKFTALEKAVHANVSLATCVKYFLALPHPCFGADRSFYRFMTVHFLMNLVLRSFVECLELLPNLHTLEIGSSPNGHDPTLLNDALGQVRLPQIQTLIIPESAHPLLKHCHNVENVVWMIADEPVTSNDFLRSLTSNRFSKVKRLAIPLALPGNPSRE